MSDISEQLREAVGNIALFPEENPYPVFRADDRGILLYANRASSDLLKKWQCKEGQVVPGFILKELTTALSKKQNRELETSCGQNIFSFVLVPIIERSYVNFYGRDVTKRKRIEAALVQGEERLKKAQEIAHIGSWELDHLNHRLTWSDEVYRIFGLCMKNLNVSYEVFLDLVHPEDRDAVNEAYISSIKDGRDSYEIEHRIIKKNTKELRYVHEKCEHTRDKNGRIVRSVGMVHDITEQKERERQINQLNIDLNLRAKELESLNKELEAFNYLVAHDLRKPLAIISGYSQIIHELYVDKLDKTFVKHIEKVSETAFHMSQFIDAHLSFTRLTNDALQIDVVDLSTMVHDVAEDLLQAEPERQVKFKIAGNITVCGDPSLLRLVIDNLIWNAWKYTHDVKAATIEFGFTATDGVVTYFVRDNGIGFDMANAGKLFLPFQRLHASAETSGFGIGLATVQKIVRRHGGEIWCEGALGEGATFYFTLGRNADCL